MTDINKILSNQQTQQTIVIEEKSETTGSTASTVNANITPVTNNVYADYCGNRLPCGYCKLMSSMCPLVNNYRTEITWNANQVTCSMEK